MTSTNASKITFSTMVPSFLHPSQQVKFARFLEALGFHHLWFPDHMSFPEGGPAYDSWSIMGAIAQATSKVTFGPAVTDPHRVHPAMLAQRVATLDQMSRGRFVLGLGSGEAMNLDAYGIEWRERKVRKISEFITVYRSLLDSREPLDFRGDFFELKRAKIKVTPYKKRHIPLYMAALGPMMQKLAGKKVDGWLPTVLPAEFYAEYFEPMAESARAAGRDPESLHKVASMVTCVDTDGTLSVEQMAETIRPLSALFVWAPVMRRLGYDFDPPEGSVGYLDVDPFSPESMEGYWKLQRWIPADMIARSLTVGNINAVTQRCQQYVETGADQIYLYNMSPDPIGSFIHLANHTIPCITGRPPTSLARLLGTLLEPVIKRGMLRRRFPGPAPKMPSP